MPASWTAFEGWIRPTAQDHRDTGGNASTWDVLDELGNLARRYVEWRCREFDGLLAEWNAMLRDLDGDPATHDWRGFRPLRLDREEDWSDWLAFLIQTATSCELALTLFSRGEVTRDTYCAPVVEREVVLSERRADIVIRWQSSCTHVEVKVGDQNFAKTHETAEKLEQQHATRWSHYILLPSEDIAVLDKSLAKSDKRIRTLTWDDVAVGVRRALVSSDESLRWRSFAHAFCGGVEQLLLGCPRADQTALSFTDLVLRQRQISIMKRAGIHERRR